MTAQLVPTPCWVRIALVPHRRRHRAVFAAAGIYNIAWGLFTVAFPQWLFAFAGMPRANHPQAFATLGMVVGLYGVLYLSVAAYPEHGWLCAAVGLTGKILGPIGLFQLIASGTLPPATIIICLTKDIIWCVPFISYLRDARPQPPPPGVSIRTTSPAPSSTCTSRAAAPPDSQRHPATTSSPPLHLAHHQSAATAATPDAP